MTRVSMSITVVMEVNNPLPKTAAMGCLQNLFNYQTPLPHYIKVLGCDVKPCGETPSDETLNRILNMSDKELAG